MFNTRVGWKVHRLIMMQWSMWFIFQRIVSPAVHTLLPLVLQALGFPCMYICIYRSSHPQWSSKKPNNYSYNLIIGPILLSSQVFFFSCWGTENIQMVPNQGNMEGDQPVQSHSHAQQPLQPQTCVQEYCPGETGLPSSVFQTVSEMSLVLLFKVLNYLSNVGLSGRKQCS